MYIAKEDIQKLASSQSVFLKGQDYYDEGRVGKLKVTQKEDCLEIVAQVNGELGDYTTNVEIYNKKIAWHECDCIESFQQEGLCMHMVAMLLKYHDQG